MAAPKRARTSASILSVPRLRGDKLRQPSHGVGEFARAIGIDHGNGKAGLAHLADDVERRAGEPGDSRDDRKTASAGGPHLGCREHPPPPFVKLTADRLPPISDGIFVNHPPMYARSPKSGIPQS
jgi:hypothetical protein